MANESVTQERVSHPSNIYSETSVFDQILFRLDGLDAMSTIAFVATESDSPPGAMVWQPFLFALGVATQDIKRDLYQLQQEHADRVSA